MRGHSYMTLF
uniref:Uncharacterized protein n=1 Tax=Anguilla anguilla TaxID=7936 RepID=A0A0E9R8P4_ANGAN